MTRYMICAVPRTGSNLLADYLARTGLAGMTDVYKAHFFIGSGEGLKSPGVWPDKMDEYFDNHRTANGVEGCKLGFDYIDHLDNFLRCDDIDDLLRSFTHYIYLTREDVVAQAVSWFIARRSGIWQVEDAKIKRPNNFQYRPVEYNFERLAFFITKIKAAYARFEAYFQEKGLDPLRLSYEEMAEDIPATVGRVLDHIGVVEHPDLRAIKPMIQKQHDPRKAEWITRYREEREARSPNGKVNTGEWNEWP